MVMETPSPQCVGREFVRQYYTLMNEAPNYLHRFYSTSSSFIHSGVDKPGQEAEPVYGQKEIHKKITELNFSDCHTKIRQVDSQATVGDGVVVQVTGELSNGGGPMRRFMQTFVLAHQNPKQYYVHNDIFRYQDEVFQDSYESEDEADQPTTDTGMTNGILSTKPEEPEVEAPLAQPVIQDSPVKAETRQSPEPVETSPPAAQIEVPPVAEPEPEPVKPVIQPKPEEPEAELAVDEPAEDTANQPPKPFSWANVVNKQQSGGNAAAVAVVSPMNSAPAAKNQALSLSVISSQQKEEEVMSNSMTTSTGPRDDQPPAGGHPNRSNRSSMEPTKRPPRPQEGGGFESGDRTERIRNNEKYPDTQQVFVGNLPHDISDLGLKRFFNGYGKVIDIRINRGGGNGKVPFGFVVFDNEEPVKQLLQLKRVEMEGHRLNVEEKKARNDRLPPRGGSRPTNQRGSSRPKDREHSGSRSDNRPSATGGRTFNAKR